MNGDCWQRGFIEFIKFEYFLWIYGVYNLSFNNKSRSLVNQAYFWLVNIADFPIFKYFAIVSIFMLCRSIIQFNCCVFRFYFHTDIVHVPLPINGCLHNKLQKKSYCSKIIAIFVCLMKTEVIIRFETSTSKLFMWIVLFLSGRVAFPTVLTTTIMF